MAEQEMVSLLSSKLASRIDAAVKSNADIPANVGNAQLPAGIENGIAHLKLCRFQKIKEGKTGAGELIFYAQARAVFPETHNSQPVAGGITSFTEPLYDQPTRGQRKTIKEQLAWIQGKMLALVGEEGSQNQKILREMFKKGAAGMDEAVAFLNKLKPHFRFRTWKGGKSTIKQCSDGKWRLFDISESGVETPNTRNIGAWPTEEAARAVNKYAGKEPQVQHDWLSHCKWVPATNAGVVNTTGPANGSQVPSAIAERMETNQVATDVEPDVSDNDVDVTVVTDDEPEGDEVQEFNEFSDLDSLAQRAIGPDEEDADRAVEELVQLALKAGIPQGDQDTPGTIDGASSWSELARMIKDKSSSTTPASQDERKVPEPVKEFTPVKGKTVRYTPPGKDSKKRPFKEQECKVITVNSKDKIATVKSLDSNTLYENVPFSDLKANT